jgi:hypothetical protein
MNHDAPLVLQFASLGRVLREFFLGAEARGERGEVFLAREPGKGFVAHAAVIGDVEICGEGASADPAEALALAVMRLSAKTTEPWSDEPTIAVTPGLVPAAPSVPVEFRVSWFDRFVARFRRLLCSH